MSIRPQFVAAAGRGVIAARRSAIVRRPGPWPAVIWRTFSFSRWMFSFRFTEYGFGVAGGGALAAAGV